MLVEDRTRQRDSAATRGLEQPMRRSTSVALIALGLLAVGSLVGARTVRADLRQATVESTATRAIGGSYALVSGAVTCTNGEAFQVILTLGQSAVGSQARGQAVDACTGESQPWTVTALTTGDGALLQPGTVRVCWNVSTYRDGQVTDVRRGCGAVTLTDPPLELDQ